MKHLKPLNGFLGTVRKKNLLKQLNAKKQCAEKELAKLQQAAWVWGIARSQALVAASLQALASRKSDKPPVPSSLPPTSAEESATCSAVEKPEFRVLKI